MNTLNLNHFLLLTNLTFFGKISIQTKFSGDKLIVRKQSEPNISYEGRITALKETDLIVVEFHNDFVKTFDHTRYLIEFTCSRSYCIRQHFAIDMALELYGMDILLPKEISLRDKPILDSVKYDDLTNIHWFNDNLNEQQQQAVAKVIRGDLLNPYLIFGPPGKYFLNLSI